MKNTKIKFGISTIAHDIFHTHTNQLYLNVSALYLAVHMLIWI